MQLARARRWLAPALVAGVAVSTACAYFNTLYNARQIFQEAQRAEARAAATRTQQDTPGINPNARQYEIVVDKCKKMIANYPDSRHVDDAMLLSARALYALYRYDEAVAALDSLERKYPKSNLLDDAAFLKGKSFRAAKKYDLAAPVLSEFTTKHRKHGGRPEALYLLCTSFMELDSSEAAVATLQKLESDHGRSDYRFKAQVEMADILAKKEFYDESIAIYQRLSESRIPESYRYDVWLGMARVQLQLGDYAGTVSTLESVKTLPRAPEKEPVGVLLRARAHAALDSTTIAIAEYKDVTKRFARGMYAAEAYYRLGEIYEGMDSLQAARQNFDEVPRAYSGSEFAEGAIKRSGDISRLLKIQETEGDDSPDALALRTFSMAEIQLFQFESPQKAIPNYEKIVNEFPDSEYAPRSVYALGYISGVVLGDTLRAREWYELLMSRYPDSAQAQLALGFYPGAAPPPPMSEWVQKKKSPAPPPADPRRPPGERPRGMVTPDSLRARVPVAADTTVTKPAKPSVAPADTTSAPADSSGGSG